MRDESSTPETSLRRASTGATGIPKKVKFDPPQTPTLAHCPPNTWNLLPHSYYTQLKVWYDVIRVLERDCTENQKTILSGFKWKHTTPKPKAAWVPVTITTPIVVIAVGITTISHAVVQDMTQVAVAVPVLHLQMEVTVIGIIIAIPIVLALSATAPRHLALLQSHLLNVIVQLTLVVVVLKC